MNDVEVLENGNVKLSIPMSFRNCSGRKQIITPETEQSLAEPLLINLARAFRWQTLIDEEHFSNVNELVNAIGKDSAYVVRVLRLTLLAPEIVHTILTGNLPDNFSVDSLKQALPVLWSEQKKLLGIE